MRRRRLYVGFALVVTLAPDRVYGQRNFIVGSEVNVSLNPRSTLILVLAKAVVHHNGPSIGGFAVRYDYIWGKGYK